MHNNYRDLMVQQSLSDQTRQSFYQNLGNREKKNTASFIRKFAVAAVCVLLIVPITAFAVENIFGVSVVEIVQGNTSSGKFGTGWEVSYPDITAKQLEDFPEEIRAMEDYRLVVYDDWAQAEEELGITLVNNTFLQNEAVTKELAYDLSAEGVYRRVHCFGQYNGKNNQFYRATVTAAYRYDNMHITLRTVVTCQHPDIPEEEAYQMHWSGVQYRDHDVEGIYQEQYQAANGINANIVTVDRRGGNATQYEATFAAGGVSYRITIKSYASHRDEEAKENLKEILESFVF